MTLEPGLRAAFRYTVTGADTAVAVGSGRVPVLATPRVLALAERATVAAVEGALEAGATTVGVRVELDHLAPARSGPSWRSRRRWSGSRAGASSSPSACATAVGRWPAV
jgi:fluoroacetyl-CoA thioesterase